MEEQKKKDGVSFTYSAKEQSEIQKIRRKYEIKEENREESKLERLRRLDSGVGKKATTWSLVIGILGSLILGSGMSIIMTEFGVVLGLQGMTGILTGVALGLFGMLLIAIAYPLYHRILQKERKKAAPEILRLTEELMR